MRIAQLNLERYGRFEDRQLAFPRQERDFHLVYGPNEAGKTTTLAALADLLFGFEHAAAYDYKFAAPLLRVGAVLEQGAASMPCRRRRGRQGTLVDAADQPIDEGPLTALLHGQRREAFLLSSSLDHARLRRGGQAMADSKDDLGQMLFAAGSGLTGLRTVLKGLDEELDSLWAPRRAEKRAYTKAERQAEEARKILRDAALKPADWSRADAERARLREEHATADGERRRTAAALSDTERLRRVLTPFKRRATLLADLAADPGVILPESVESSAFDALATALAQEHTRDAALNLLASVDARLAAEPDDVAALSLADRIDALVQQIGAERDRIEQLPRREAELALKLENAQAAAVRLGLVLQDGVLTTLPSQAEVARLRELAGTGALARTRATDAHIRATRAAEESAQADAGVANLDAPEGLEQVRAAVAAGRRAGDLDAQVDAKRLLVTRATGKLTDALATLKPWTGTAEALQGLTLPTDAAIDAAAAQVLEADRLAGDARRSLEERSRDLEAAQARLANLSRVGDAVTTEELNTARADRDTELAAVRDHLSGTEVLDEPNRAAERLVNAVRAADAIADHRYAAADASAQLAHAEAELAEQALRHVQAVRLAETSTATSGAVRQVWDDGLTALGLPEASPVDLRAWLGRRMLALKARSDSLDAEMEWQTKQGERRRAVDQLAVAAGTTAGEDAVLASILAEVESRLGALEGQGQRLADAARDAEQSRDRLRQAEQTRDAAQRELQAWRVGWDKAVVEAGLSGLDAEAAEARLAVYETLRSELEAARSLQHRIAAMGDDGGRFAAEAQAVAAALSLNAPDPDPLSLVSQAKDQLARAREIRTRRTSLAAEADQRRNEAAAAQARLDAAQTALTEVQRLTGATDRVALAAALEAARSRRAKQDDLARLDLDVARQAAGRPLAELEAACDGETEETLAERAARLTQDADDSARNAQDASERAAEAQLRFDQLDSGASAADAASDLEQARAEMEALAEVYLLRRTQRILLDYAMRRQADRRRNPLLARAAEHFRRLTLGCYADLRVDHDADKPRLLGLCADGHSTVTVADMSEGTQDQLFLGLRLAALEQALQAGIHLPFLADDLFVTFDDDRARAGLEVLGELSRKTQVLFFTHHAHLRTLAAEVFSSASLSIVDLSPLEQLDSR
jgi:uncharacterized protein YhaN